MKKNLVLMAFLLLASTLGIEVSAQFPIKIPKIPKNDKSKENQQQPENNRQLEQTDSKENEVVPVSKKADTL